MICFKKIIIKWKLKFTQVYKCDRIIGTKYVYSGNAFHSKRYFKLSYLVTAKFIDSILLLYLTQLNFGLLK